MKKMLKTLICLAIAASMCVFSCSFAMAEEAEDLDLDALEALFGESDEDAAEGNEDAESSDEESMAQLLQLLALLSGESSEDAALGEAIEAAEYVAGPVTFYIPATWTAEGEGTEYQFTSSEGMSFISFSLGIGEGDEFDIHNEENINGLIESMGDEGSEVSVYDITVCGQDGLWLQVSMGDEDFAMTVNMVLIQLDGAVAAFTSGSMTDPSPALFASLINAVKIDGAEGATDLSAVAAGPIAAVTVDGVAVSAADNTVSAASQGAAASENAIDASGMDEVVLVDNDVCKVVIKKMGVPEDDWYAYSMKIFVENKSDLDIYVTTEDGYVNGFQCDPWWGESVSAGHKVNSELTFWADDFAEIGIEEVKDFSFRLVVRDDNDYSADDLVSEAFDIFPAGFDVEPQPEPVFDESAITLVDNELCKVVIYNFDFDDYYFIASTYIENKCDKNLEISVSGSTCVNGYEINPYFYQEVVAGKKAFKNMTWNLDELAENDIEVIEELELDLKVSDRDDWFADPFYEDVITITF